jgi:hypothetical protein
LLIYRFQDRDESLLAIIVVESCSVFLGMREKAHLKRAPGFFDVVDQVTLGGWNGPEIDSSLQAFRHPENRWRVGQVGPSERIEEFHRQLSRLLHRDGGLSAGR